MKTITSTGASFQRNASPQTLDQLSYTYDADGNIHTETIAPSNTLYTYQYNNLNQLQNFKCTGSECPNNSHNNKIGSNDYTYTLNNGLQSITTKNQQGQITNTATYQYDLSYPDRLKNITNSNNNLNQPGTYSYDKNGNVTTNANGDTLTYDALNQMLSIEDGSNKLIESYGYNADGKQNQEILPGKATPIDKYYGGNGKAVTAKIQGNASVTYAMGTERIAQYYVSSQNEKTSPAAQYYLYDQRGSVTNVLNATSNDNTSYVYSPFGYLSTSGKAVKKDAPSGLEKNTFGYIGQSLNPTTKLMMMGGYRAYDPAVGTFLKADSYSPFRGAGTFNGFNYGAGNPVLFSDPSGHMPKWLSTALIVIAEVAITAAAEMLTAGLVTGVITGAGTLVGESCAIFDDTALVAGTFVAQASGDAVCSVVGDLTYHEADSLLSHRKSPFFTYIDWIAME
jgi:RHS repeat-associated protein